MPSRPNPPSCYVLAQLSAMFLADMKAPSLHPLSLRLAAHGLMARLTG